MGEYLEWCLGALAMGLDPTGGVSLPTGLYDVLTRLGFIALVAGAVVLALAWLVNLAGDLVRGPFLAIVLIMLAVIGIPFIGLIWNRAGLWVGPWAILCLGASTLLFGQAFTLPRAFALLRAPGRFLFAAALALFFAAGGYLSGMDPLLTKTLVVALEASLMFTFLVRVSRQTGDPAPLLGMGCLVVLAAFVDRNALVPAPDDVSPVLTGALASTARVALLGAFPAGLLGGVVSLFAARSGQTDERALLESACRLALMLMVLAVIVWFLIGGGLREIFGPLFERYG